MNKQIKEYIEYLKRTHGMDISVHLAKRYTYLFFTSVLGEYNTHTNPYCICVKSTAFDKCILCQEAIIRKPNGQKSFAGVCHAGVGEYIHRLFIDGECVGFISVSGYKGRNIPDRKYTDNMRDEEIDIKILDTVIFPLAMMAERLIKYAPPQSEGETYMHMLWYINAHYASVTVDELSREFSFCRSYISHMFRQKNGQTLKSYCNSLKIRDAKALLRETDMSVTEIAYAAGFCDCSYFINTFRKITGTTPLKWRRKEAQNG